MKYFPIGNLRFMAIRCIARTEANIAVEFFVILMNIFLVKW